MNERQWHTYNYQVYDLLQQRIMNLLDSQVKTNDVNELNRLPEIVFARALQEKLSKNEDYFIDDNERATFLEKKEQFNQLYNMYLDAYADEMKKCVSDNRFSSVANYYLNLKQEDLTNMLVNLPDEIELKRKQIAKAGYDALTDVEKKHLELTNPELLTESMKKNNNLKLVRDSSPKNITNFKDNRPAWKRVLVGGMTVLLTIGILSFCNTQHKQTDEVVPTEQVVEVQSDEVISTDEQISIAVNALNSTLPYGNNADGAIAYDAWLVSNLDAVYQDNDFIAQLNYKASASEMLQNTISYYRGLSYANVHRALGNNTMDDYSNIFMNEADQVFASEIQQLSYDIFQYAASGNDAKVEEIKEAFNSKVANLEFKNSIELSDQVKLYALVNLDTVQAYMQSYYGTQVLSSGDFEEYINNDLANCVKAIEGGNVQDLLDTAYFKDLGKLEDLAEDLANEANGKIKDKLTRDEIVEAINLGITSEYVSDMELHSVTDEDPNLGIGKVTQNADGTQKVEAGGHTSGGNYTYPEGKKETGTETEVIVDESRGEEVIKEETTGGDHDQNLDGKEDTTGEDITINPGGEYDPNIPMLPEDGIQIEGKPGQIVGETFVPIEDGSSNNSSEEVIDEEIVDSPAQQSYTQDVAPASNNQETVIEEVEVASPAYQPVQEDTQQQASETAPQTTETQTEATQEQQDYMNEMGVSEITETDDYGKTM